MMIQKKWYYGMLLVLLILVLGGCGKDRKSAYLVTKEEYSANYSCKDKDGRDIIGNKVTYGIEQKEEMTEGEKLEAIAGLAGKGDEKNEKVSNVMSGNVIEAEVQWKNLDGKEKTYLLRGEELESYVTEEDGKEIYKDRSDVQ